MVLTDDWWATSEGLVEMAEVATGVELAPKARLALVEMSVELIVLLTCWPGTARPADALAYLRSRRARMVAHAPWLYALPLSVRQLLVGTDRLPSLLTFVVGGRHVDEALRTVWRKALDALASHLEAAELPATELTATPMRPRPPTELPGLHSGIAPGPVEFTTRALSGGGATVGPWRRYGTWDWHRAPWPVRPHWGQELCWASGCWLGRWGGRLRRRGGPAAVATTGLPACGPAAAQPLGGAVRGCRGDRRHSDGERRRAGPGHAYRPHGRLRRTSAGGPGPRAWPRREPGHLPTERATPTWGASAEDGTSDATATFTAWAGAGARSAGGGSIGGCSRRAAALARSTCSPTGPTGDFRARA